MGINRTGGLLYVTDWPNGSGYTHYKWRLDTNQWSSEIPISTPIVLNNLSSGPHSVEVTGKNDAGFYQNDPAYGANAVVTRSTAWTVLAPEAPLAFTAVERGSEAILLRFSGLTGKTYTVQWNAALDGSSAWQTLTNIPALSESAQLNSGLTPSPSAVRASPDQYALDLSAG